MEEYLGEIITGVVAAGVTWLWAKGKHYKDKLEAYVASTDTTIDDKVLAAVKSAVKKQKGS